MLTKAVRTNDELLKGLALGELVSNYQQENNARGLHFLLLVFRLGRAVPFFGETSVFKSELVVEY